MLVDVPVEPHQSVAERLRQTGQRVLPAGSGTYTGGTVIDYEWAKRSGTPDLMGVFHAAAQITTSQVERHFVVDPDRIDELIDWALARDWESDEGERARRDAWRR